MVESLIWDQFWWFCFNLNVCLCVLGMVVKSSEDREQHNHISTSANHKHKVDQLKDSISGEITRCHCNLKEVIQLIDLAWEGHALCGLGDACNTEPLLVYLMRQASKSPSLQI